MIGSLAERSPVEASEEPLAFQGVHHRNSGQSRCQVCALQILAHRGADIVDDLFLSLLRSIAAGSSESTMAARERSEDRSLPRMSSLFITRWTNSSYFAALWQFLGNSGAGIPPVSEGWRAENREIMPRARSTS